MFGQQDIEIKCKYNASTARYVAHIKCVLRKRKITNGTKNRTDRLLQWDQW